MQSLELVYIRDFMEIGYRCLEICDKGFLFCDSFGKYRVSFFVIGSLVLGRLGWEFEVLFFVIRGNRCFCNNVFLGISGGCGLRKNINKVKNKNKNYGMLQCVCVILRLIGFFRIYV